jgi:hypothetical protein
MPVVHPLLIDAEQRVRLAATGSGPIERRAEPVIDERCVAVINSCRLPKENTY